VGVLPAPPPEGDSQRFANAVKLRHITAQQLADNTLQTAARQQPIAASSAQPQDDVTPRWRRRQQRVLQQQASEGLPAPQGGPPPPLLQQPEAPLELGRQPSRPPTQQPQRPPEPVQPQQRPPAAPAPPPRAESINHKEIATRPAPQPERTPGQPAGSVEAGQVSVGEAPRHNVLPIRHPCCALQQVS
jgi:hypothetical protein